jgi:hypothetical protein
MIPELADSRALGMKDEPFSAYCRVCWQRVYALWIDTVPHGGVCPFGASKLEDCDQAMDWERVTGEIRSHLAETRKP